MGSLPVCLRQIAEIVKAARTGAQVVMLDEPTSAISEREVEGLYGIVRQLSCPRSPRTTSTWRTSTS